MEDQKNNEVIEAVEKGLEKMENEGVLNASDFTKPWRSSDVIFLVDVSVNTFFGTLHILWLQVVYTSKIFFHFLK